MRKLLAIGMLLASVSAASADWFFAHMGAEPCVAVENIDVALGERLYYHSGKLHTPEDVMQAFADAGFTVTKRSESDSGMVAFNATIGGRATLIMLIKGERMCNGFMSMQRK